MNKIGSVLVSWDFSHGKDSELVLVGKKNPNGPVVVINAFKGEKAREVYSMLTGGGTDDGRDV